MKVSVRQKHLVRKSGRISGMKTGRRRMTDPGRKSNQGGPWKDLGRLEATCCQNLGIKEANYINKPEIMVFYSKPS